MSNNTSITVLPRQIQRQTVQQKYADMPVLSRTAARIPRSEMPKELDKFIPYRTFPALVMTSTGPERTFIQVSRRRVKAPTEKQPNRMVWKWAVYEYDGFGGVQRHALDVDKPDCVNALTDIYAQYIALDDRDVIGASAWEYATQFVKAVMR